MPRLPGTEGSFGLTRKLRQLTCCGSRYRRRSGSRAVSAYNQYAIAGACPLPLGPGPLRRPPGAISRLTARGYFQVVDRSLVCHGPEHIARPLPV